MLESNNVFNSHVFNVYTNVTRTRTRTRTHTLFGCGSDLSTFIFTCHIILRFQIIFIPAYRQFRP